MRLIALLAVLATSTASMCERRNPQVCRQEAGQEECDGDLVCRGGLCVERECRADVACADPARPICDVGSARCVACDSDDQCRARNPDVPYCDKGSCVRCTRSEHCADPLAPVCDPVSAECRPCALHRECASGVCAKDRLLESLTDAPKVPQGSCVPRERVLVVDANRCVAGDPCNPKDALARVSPQQPYVLVRSGQGAMFTGLVVPGPGNMSGLKTVHLIGPLADVPPVRASTSAATLGAPLSRALAVEPGHRLVAEGLVIEGGITGIECNGIGRPEETELLLLRSVIGGTRKAISATECRLTVRESWIGAGFKPLFERMIGNELAMEVRNSELRVENSVLFRNGLLGAFGGIDLLYDGPSGRSVIVNSTIAYHSVPAASGAVSIDCNMALGERLVVFNTFIYNDLLKWQMQPTRHVGAVCQPWLGPVATNDPELAQAAAGGVLLPNEVDTGFENPKGGDLRLRADAPERIAKGGVALFERGSVKEEAPKRDMLGAERGPRPSIGSFEAPGR